MIHIKNGKAIIYYDPSLNTTVITYPMYDWIEPDESEESLIQRVIAKDLPKDAIDIRIVDAKDIPYDPKKRHALKPDLTYDEKKLNDGK